MLMKMESLEYLKWIRAQHKYKSEASHSYNRRKITIINIRLGCHTSHEYKYEKKINGKVSLRILFKKMALRLN